MSIVVCGLSVGGSCFGMETDFSRKTLKQRYPYLMEVMQSSSNVVRPLPKRAPQIQNADIINLDKVKIVDAGKGFRTASKFMNSDKLNLKYGTEDGVAYYLGNGKNVFLQCKDGPSGRTPVQSIHYGGHPVFGLRQALENKSSVFSGIDKVANKVVNEVDVSRVEVKEAGRFFRKVYKYTGLSNLLSSMFGTREGTVYCIKNNKNVFLWRNKTSSGPKMISLEYSGDPVEGLIQML